ncbi:hypothetical protein H1R20_g10056, partial [Candolleomyces eurysporus]
MTVQSSPRSDSAYDPSGFSASWNEGQHYPRQATWSPNPSYAAPPFQTDSNYTQQNWHSRYPAPSPGQGPFSWTQRSGRKTSHITVGYVGNFNNEPVGADQVIDQGCTYQWFPAYQSGGGDAAYSQDSYPDPQSPTLHVTEPASIIHPCSSNSGENLSMSPATSQKPANPDSSAGSSKKPTSGDRAKKTPKRRPGDSDSDSDDNHDRAVKKDGVAKKLLARLTGSSKEKP